MAARLSLVEARRLGITPRPRGRTTRRTAPGPYHSRCVTCGDEFTTHTAEDEHVRPGHHRFETL